MVLCYYIATQTGEEHVKFLFNVDFFLLIFFFQTVVLLFFVVFF